MPTLEPFPEYDDLKKTKPVEPKEEEYDMVIVERKPTSFKRICVTILLSWLMLSLVIGTLAIVYQPAQGPLVVIEEFNVDYKNEQVIVSELVPNEVQVFVVNLTRTENIPLDAAFYSCIHTPAAPVIGCVSQYVVPDFDECLDLTNGNEEDLAIRTLDSPRAIPVCGLLTLGRGEFTPCSLDEPVFISIWNLADRKHTAEATFSFDDCANCQEIDGTCGDYSTFWISIFTIYLVSLFAMSACIGVCCGALHAERGMKQEESDSSESDDNNVDDEELAELVNRY